MKNCIFLLLILNAHLHSKAYEHKVFELYHVAIDQDLEKLINNFWNSLINSTPDKSKKLLTLNNEHRIIIARGTQEEIKELENFIKEIDKQKVRVKLDMVLISTEREFDLAFGINWSGIYNRLKTVILSIKDFDFIGLGSTLKDFPEPTEPVRSQSRFAIAQYGNLFVNPNNFSINLFVPPISTDFGEKQTPSLLGVEIIESVLNIPFVFGGPDLNLSRLNLLLNANELENRIHITSRPSIITNDNQVAKLLVGTSLPFYSTIEQSIPLVGATDDVKNLSTLFFRDVGVSIQIKPKVQTDKKQIALDVFLEFSAVSAGSTLVANNTVILNPPTIITLKLKDNVVLENGQTTIIGGLSNFALREDVNKVPYISKIPILGKLFTAYGQQKKYNDDFIFITSTIIE